MESINTIWSFCTEREALLRCYYKVLGASWISPLDQSHQLLFADFHQCPQLQASCVWFLGPVSEIGVGLFHQCDLYLIGIRVLVLMFHLQWIKCLAYVEFLVSLFNKTTRRYLPILHLLFGRCCGIQFTEYRTPSRNRVWLVFSYCYRYITD